MKEFFLGIKSFLRNLDKGLYFVLFAFPTTIIVLWFQGWVVSYFYLIVISYMHAFYLKVNPYISDSEYYRYKVLRERFFEQNIVYNPLLSKRILFFCYLGLMFMFYLSFLIPEYALVLFPLQSLITSTVISSNTVDVINILYRPNLPESIYKYHPVLQRRYSPVVDVVINKIVPLCIKTGSSLLAGYTAVGMGWKALHGPTEIDPIRNYVCNKYHGFPTSYKWTEASLSSWSTFQKTDAVQGVPHDTAIRKFMQAQDSFTSKLEDLATSVLRRKTK